MANRFWVGGTGTWDSATTTHWSATTGGAGGASVPGSADNVTFDASSGGGTVTLNFGGTITIQTITMGAFTGTWDNSVNNNNMNLLGAIGLGFSGSGSGVRTIKLGSATYTLSSSAAKWDFLSTTNLTYLGSSATISFTGTTSNRIIAGGGLSHGTLNLGASSNAVGANIYSISGSNTFAAVNITAPNFIEFSFSSTQIITAAVAWAGAATTPIALNTTSYGSQAHVNLTAGSTLEWCGIRDIDFGLGSAPTTLSCLDLGDNNGVTITPPVIVPSVVNIGVIGG